MQTPYLKNNDDSVKNIRISPPIVLRKSHNKDNISSITKQTGLFKLKNSHVILYNKKSSVDTKNGGVILCDYKFKLKKLLKFKYNAKEEEKKYLESFLLWASSAGHEVSKDISDESIYEILKDIRTTTKSCFQHEKLLLNEKCPDLLLWKSGKKKMESNNVLMRIPTIGKTGKKGSRLENAKEFAYRVLNEAGINEYPYLHEIRSINPVLGKALDQLAAKEGVNIREWFPVFKGNPLIKHINEKLKITSNG